MPKLTNRRPTGGGVFITISRSLMKDVNGAHIDRCGQTPGYEFNHDVEKFVYKGKKAKIEQWPWLARE